MGVNAGMALLGILGALVMRFILQRANKQLESGTDVAAVMKGEAEVAIAGVSEEERLARKQEFRYIS